jgi:hypothetical protein
MEQIKIEDFSYSLLILQILNVVFWIVVIYFLYKILKKKNKNT